MVESVMFVLISYMSTDFARRKDFSGTRSYEKKATEGRSMENGLFGTSKGEKKTVIK
jgi:hypothetical protein